NNSERQHSFSRGWQVVTPPQIYDCHGKLRQVVNQRCSPERLNPRSCLYPPAQADEINCSPSHGRNCTLTERDYCELALSRTRTGQHGTNDRMLSANCWSSASDNI